MNNAKSPAKFMTINEAAEMNILPKYALRRRLKEGRLPGIYNGQRFMVNIDMLLEQLDQESRNAVRPLTEKKESEE